MADIKAWFRGSRKIWLVGAVVALVLLWAIEQPFFLCHTELQLLIREVAFAVIIACVFGLTIEQIQRTEFIRLVTEEREVLKKDVFLYAYGSSVPEQIRQEIRSSILNQAFYRDDLVVDWEYSTVKDDAELMSVKKRYHYTVTNNSSEKKIWPFSLTTVGADGLRTADDSILNILKIRRGDTTKQYKESDLKREEIADQPHSKKVSLEIEIRPQEKFEVYLELCQLRRVYGDDKYNSKEPVVGTTRVTLRFPPNSNFEVTVTCKTQSLKPANDNDPPPCTRSNGWAGSCRIKGLRLVGHEKWKGREVCKRLVTISNTHFPPPNHANTIRCVIS
jgi:hypothetical protein